jgi:acyl-CoA reductase-like NAD-dependent aldehyde dehydrogenase
MKVSNPATEELVADVPEDTPASVTDKVARARRGQGLWAAVPLAERVAVLRRFRDLLEANVDRLALTLTREMGKPVAQARNEIKATPARIDFFLSEAPNVLREETVLRQQDDGAGEGRPPKLEEKIAHEPLGVVANVSAWNYPYFVGSNVFVPALLTGNAVLYKPSEFATLTGLAITELLHDAGVPIDAFVPVIGGGSIGAALVNARVDGVYFTGSHATGKKIAEAAAGRLVKVQLELGGKDPTYVTDDVDVRAAAESLADGAFYNTGQSCCSVERIYVHERVAPAFLEAFVETVRGFVVGDPEDERTYVGPLARKAQLGVLERQVEDAIGKGARLLQGGHRIARKGHYFEPTVLADAPQDALVMREESFGPIIGIATVEDDDEALELMNDTDYGLTAGVYARDRARAERILGAVDAGSVYWNCCDRVSPRLPWTGRKSSGIGSTLSHYGIRTFLRPKAWHLRQA